MLRRLATLLGALALTGLSGAGYADPPAPGAGAKSQSGVDLAGIDRSVVPGDDFFAYANGTWVKATEIPADRSAYGPGSVLAELADQRVAALVQEVGATAGASAEERKIGAYYASFMDEAAVEKKGLEPLLPTLQRIRSIRDRHELAGLLGSTLRSDVDVLNSTQLYTPNLFGLWVAADLGDPTHYSPFLLQGGLGMPDRDYYLSSSQSMAAIRPKYQAHIVAVLKLAQIPDAEAKAGRIFELEHRMAEVHATRADSEEIEKGNNAWSRKEFEQRAPGLDWQAYFAAAALEHESRFVVWQPGALQGLSGLTASQPLSTWKDYLEFHAIERASPYLSAAFANEYFAFHGKVLSGIPEQRPRWKRAVRVTNDALGDAVGRLYVERYFPPAEKARAQAMVANLLAAFSARIERLDWMAPQTKVKAKAKLNTLRVSVGYPDKWRDYSALDVIRGDPLGNAERAELFEYHRNLGKLHQPVDRSEWVMVPQEVNAVNLPVLNALNFPAAILQPPYFDSHRPAAMDYAAIGAVIGHEISHSFDNQGALFDAAGRLDNWWTKEDFAHFEAASARLADQYDRYRPFPDLAVNGRQTLSENIADVAGLSAAYDAYQLSLHGAAAPSVGGFSGDQLFFLSFAQMWRQKIREPALRREIVTDGHSPSQYRAQTVRNLDAWYPAFAVKQGQALYLAPGARVRIW